MSANNYNSVDSPFISQKNGSRENKFHKKKLFLLVALCLFAALMVDLHASEEDIPSVQTEKSIGVQSGSETQDSGTGKQTIEEFVTSLAAKKPTPGGGAAAAVGASIGAAAAVMSAAYTQRKKDVESGCAAYAKTLVDSIDLNELIALADEDAKAYAALQKTWTDQSMSAEEKQRIEAEALAVPVKLVTLCRNHISSITDFLPKCNPQITSDAKVGIHQLAGAARAAYQTALVNKPDDGTKAQLASMLLEIQEQEMKILVLEAPGSSGGGTSAEGEASTEKETKPAPKKDS